MRFNNLFKNLSKYFYAALLLGSMTASLIACTVSTGPNPDEYNIGDKLNAVSAIRSSNGPENATFVLFDDVLKKIHQFDSTSLRKIRTLEVKHPNQKNYVLHDPNGNYIIDLTLKGFTIFDNQNRAQNDPVHLQGVPKSAAFDPAQGYLVLYDDLMNVGIIQLDSTGKIQRANTFGPVVNDATITSGEMLSGNRLILSLSDGSLATVDVLASLQQNKWVYTVTPTAFSSGFSWVARVRTVPQEVLVKASDRVALINTVTGQTVGQYIVSYSRLKKLSKSVDPHVIVGDEINTILVYTDGTSMKTRQLRRSGNFILDSQLDLTNDSWLLADGDERYQYDIFSGDVNLVKTNRKLNTYQFSSLLIANSLELPANAQVRLASTFFFALFPSDLGYAYKQDFTTGARTETKGFNVKEFDQ